jgi:hypothetical protein
MASWAFRDGGGLATDGVGKLKWDESPLIQAAGIATH